MRVEIDQIITQIISFLIILWILSRYAWKPLLKLLDDRKEKIRADWSEIDKQKMDAQKLISEYQEKLKQLDIQALQKMNQVIEEAKVQSQAIQEEAHRQAKVIILHAQEDLQKEFQQAKVKMKREMIDIALSAAEKVLEKNVDREEQKKYLDSLIDRMEAH